MNRILYGLSYVLLAFTCNAMPENNMFAKTFNLVKNIPQDVKINVDRTKLSKLFKLASSLNNVRRHGKKFLKSTHNDGVQEAVEEAKTLLKEAELNNTKHLNTLHMFKMAAQDEATVALSFWNMYVDSKKTIKQLLTDLQGKNKDAMTNATNQLDETIKKWDDLYQNYAGAYNFWHPGTWKSNKTDVLDTEMCDAFIFDGFKAVDKARTQSLNYKYVELDSYFRDVAESDTVKLSETITTLRQRNRTLFSLYVDFEASLKCSAAISDIDDIQDHTTDLSMSDELINIGLSSNNNANPYASVFWDDFQNNTYVNLECVLLKLLSHFKAGGAKNTLPTWGRHSIAAYPKSAGISTDTAVKLQEKNPLGVIRDDIRNEDVLPNILQRKKFCSKIVKNAPQNQESILSMSANALKEYKVQYSNGISDRNRIKDMCIKWVVNYPFVIIQPGNENTWYHYQKEEDPDCDVYEPLLTTDCLVHTSYKLEPFVSISDKIFTLDGTEKKGIEFGCVAWPHTKLSMVLAPHFGHVKKDSGFITKYIDGTDITPIKMGSPNVTRCENANLRCLSAERRSKCCLGKQMVSKCLVDERKYTKEDCKINQEQICEDYCDNLGPKDDPPVCGGKVKYDNECKAKCKGETNLFITTDEAGCLNEYDSCGLCNLCAECAEDSDCEVDERCKDNKCWQIKDTGCVCTREYMPVCCDGITYSNQCTAECANCYGIVPGECSRPPPEPCICTKEYRPVCCNGKTYGNKCMAKCDNCKTQVHGICPEKFAVTKLEL